MDVVFTPSHAPGHVSLHFPEVRFLIAADALTVSGNTLQRLSEQYTLEMDQAIDSAGTLAE